MHRLFAILIVGGWLMLPASSAQAQTLGDGTCLTYAAQQAMPSLAQSYAITPSGYGPYGWGPFMQPFSAGPYGPLTAYSPPGLAPVYGPLGPGLTANAIASAIPPGGFGFHNQNINNFANTSTLINLASLQQAELGTLYGRYGLGAGYQAAAATWSTAGGVRSLASFAVALALCTGQELQQIHQLRQQEAQAQQQQPQGQQQPPGALPPGAPGY